MDPFKPKGELLNFHFEGYKLSSNSLTHIGKALSDPVMLAKVGKDEFSYQHLRAHTLHNHLHYDPSDSYSVYWCNNHGSVIKGTLHHDAICTQSVFNLSIAKIEPWINFSLLFLGNKMGIVCAGDANIILFKIEEYPSTENTNSISEQWNVLSTLKAGDLGAPVTLVTAGLGARGHRVDILCALFSSSSNKETLHEEQEDALVLYKWLRIDLKFNPSLTADIRTDDVFDDYVMCEIPSRTHALYSAFQHDNISTEQR